MLLNIVKFFSSLGDVISAFFDYLITCFSELISVIEYSLHSLDQIPIAFSWLPTDVVNIIFVIFGIVIVYKIAGREG